MAGILFENIFDIREIDRDGKKFDKVSRVEGSGENYEMELVLDVNTDIYPIEIGQKFTLVLASTLDLGGAKDKDHYEPINKPSLLDKYEYVMCGKVYKYLEEKGHKVSVYVSFGGLLMKLRGDERNLQALTLDSKIYLLMRRIP
eukprot:TRINITY_DN12734_c0_g1_i1.p1 TRINITY_DN12734_c0_g1~~TRINITY_DN12734_c0_g1_i1.p1  ORF type:complete len:144 (-),score=34.75 TRINITY_DN12734_c0_g1_i1:64-495(-)